MRSVSVTNGAPNPQALRIKSRLSPVGVSQRYRRSAAATGVAAIEAFHERGIFRKTTTRHAGGGEGSDKRGRPGWQDRAGRASSHNEGNYAGTVLGARGI